MIRPLVFADLDDTLFQTLPKCAESEGDHLVQAATAGNGKHSFMTRPQQGLVRWLLDTSDLVPVTARGTVAYASVSIPFAAGAVVANGAVILRPDGTPDPEWQARMRPALDAVRAELDLVLDSGRKLAEANGIDARSWLVEEDGMAAYAVFKENGAGNGANLEGISGRLPAPQGWTLHRNGNNLAYLPPCLSKVSAVAYLIERARGADPARPVIGLGDSLTDFPFLERCDWWGAPRRSQVTQAVTEAHHAVHGARS